MNHHCLLIGYGNIARIHAKYLTKQGITWDWYDPYLDIDSNNRVLALDRYLIDYKGYTRIFILTPEHTHYDQYKLIRSMYEGYIFVEKPAATCRDHIEEMLKDQKLIVGLVERFNPAITTLVANVELENLINIDFHRCCVADDSSPTEILADIGIHDIDLFCHLTKAQHIRFDLTHSYNTVALTIKDPRMCRFIWSKDTYFKERKIIVRQSNYTLVVDLQEQSVIKYYYHAGKVVSESLYVEKSSPIENEQRNLLSPNPEIVHGLHSHRLLMEVLEV